MSCQPHPHPPSRSRPSTVCRSPRPLIFTQALPINSSPSPKHKTPPSSDSQSFARCSTAANPISSVLKEDCHCCPSMSKRHQVHATFSLSPSCVEDSTEPTSSSGQPLSSFHGSSLALGPKSCPMRHLPLLSSKFPPNKTRVSPFGVLETN